MRRTVNVKAVLVVLGSCAALGVAVHLAHGFQVRRNTRGLLEQAALAEKEGCPEQAVEHLALYLELVPADADALARYGCLLDQLARQPREKLEAFFVLERAVSRAPAHADLRRKAATRALELGRFGEARAHLETLRKASPADPGLLQLLGRCEAGTHEFAKAAEWFAWATRLAPADSDLAVEYARLLRERLGRPEAADEVIEAMVGADERSFRGRLAAARYHLQAGAPDRADTHARFAREQLQARDADLLVLAADIALARGRPDEARARLEDAQVRYPENAPVGRALAGLAFRAGRPEEALRCLRPTLHDLPGRVEELWGLANLLIDLGQVQEAQRVIRRVRDSGGAPVAACLVGRLAMRRQAWGEARRTLEAARPGSLRWPELSRDLNSSLAECYARLGNPDQQLEAYRTALEADPTCLPARRSYAAALLALGRADEAVEEYRNLANRVPEARLDLARALLRHHQLLPAGGRAWAEIDQALAALPAEQKATPEAQLLRAEVLAARGQPDEARRLARALCDREPRPVAPWLFLVDLAERQGQRPEAARLLGEAERRAGPRVEWHLAWLRHALDGDPAEARQRLRDAQEALGQFPGVGGEQLLQALAEAALALGDREKAAQFWGRLAERRPGDVRPRFRLFELALQQGKEDEARRLLGQLREVEGDGALAAFGEAACQAARARRGERQALAEAHRLLARAALLRPSWSHVPLLQAEVYELEGNKEKALAKYQAAVERGDVRPPVLRRLLQLASEQGRYAEASALLRGLPEGTLASPELGRLAAQVEFFAPGDGPRRALERARQAVAKDSKDYRDYLWLGQIAALAGETAEAGEAFREARNLAPDVPDTWLALILFLARVDVRKAETELAAAGQRLPRDKLPLVLGPAYEAFGKPEPAEEQYRAVAARDNTPAALRGLAAFYERTGQQARAEPVLRQLLEPGTRAPEETLRWARRALALTLAFHGTYRQFGEAQALLDENGKADAEETEDRRVRALVLASQPAHRREAIGLLQSLPPDRAASQANVQFLLAQLYEADGDWRRARWELLALLHGHDKNPVYVAHYVKALLRHQEADQAEVWVDRLADLGRPALEVLDLRAHVLHANGNSAEAAALIRAYANGPGARLDAAALLLDRVGQPAEAEALFRRHVATSPDPAGLLLLVQHLARQGRLAEALELCERAWQTCPPEAAAGVSVAALRYGRPTEEQQRAVERRLRDAIAREARPLVLEVRLAQLLEQSGRYAEAVALYRRVLAADPRNVVAGNNLAFLLAVRGDKGGEAPRLIQEAIAEAGPQAELLDTRAVVYLAGGAAAQALGDLQEAVAQAPSPAKYFHLARAHQLAGDGHAAQQAYRRATELDLKETDMHPLEREGLRQLARELKQ
jgi:tetratricopeptide (TPR) repeat protein